MSTFSGVVFSMLMGYFVCGQTQQKELPKEVQQAIEKIPVGESATVAIRFPDKAVDAKNFLDRTSNVRKQLEKWKEDKKITGFHYDSDFKWYTFQAEKPFVKEAMIWCVGSIKDEKWSVVINGKTATIKE